MQHGLELRCRELLTELDYCQPGEPLTAEPLTGGVASDIAKVTVGDRKCCVKFALSKLKVEADWFAPVHRNAAEYAWLEVAADVAPESAVRLYGRSGNLHGFAMEFLEGDDIYLWKTALLAEAPDHGEASAVGALLGKVHAASALRGFDTTAFQNRDDFDALRIEPYISYTASHHEDLAEQLNAIAKQLYEADKVLIHGDVSPKNILFRRAGPVVLDAECATMGDACFDPAFCMNHLVLKAMHLPGARERYLQNVLDWWRAYLPFVNWEPADCLEKRVCNLLPALMLGRVDGKSPVEYLTPGEQEDVRRVARHFIKVPVDRLEDLVQGILQETAA